MDGWSTASTSTTVANASGQLRLQTTNTAAVSMSKTYSSTADKKYRISFDVDAGVYTNVTVDVLGYNNASLSSATVNSGITRYQMDFIANDATTKIVLKVSTGSGTRTIYLDNVKLEQINGNIEGYDFAFNGQEKDDEVVGAGNSYDFGERIYSSRLGRFLSVDPILKEYPELSPYQFAGNMPIWAIDLDGLEPAVKLPDGTYTTARDGQLSGIRISPEALKYYKTLTPPEDERPDPDYEPQNFFPGFGDIYDFRQGVQDWKAGNKGIAMLSFGSLIPGGDFVFKPLKIVIKNADAVKNLVKYAGKAGKETVIVTKTGFRTDAKKVIDGIVGDLGDKMRAVEGQVKNQKGRITGLQSGDKSKGWRIDWDPKNKEAHYNYWNNKTGEKGKVIFEGTKEQVETLIDQLTKTYDAVKE